ncbi:HpcH/HpaI aldolase/citrate lyase family protein [Nocardia cyriacigeorgica]|jgi:citrate lyase beta subunit|uniref:HpcH/HpaI aldolase/citrate lyase family protein n=1 Tax=Nocardia cyriacigeorgica TaxID=135487 RepID=UPI0015E35FE7|nr:HpcH/HpaI aldolase/citrate lyase family protein [Nocardia cyriacigeorgica]MBF6085946.1 HpcH/HpaI aldolase/citrate lyase family protein [Nocardia cyriacigeorgica]MBF6092036.1 HpcH/HpaI aldolase/citrate lyase family protein [Nocardia cyriacigeorgica]MBF6099981.1 HpcH/HpaI aldolase/citrate lyase family protein [Nocardia cyriacigeorgica]MBF6321048.1 HpcH/HpaI aldolase/citrate lyase family protein [Nocardia cyriacigeorgica]MBF6394317.1 HpcH/HpaI aldolase/citrate lyase family protein [Nocardia cy
MTAGIAVKQEVSLRKRVLLRHFRQLNGPDARTLFHRQPEPIGGQTDRELLAVALGATLYAPATRADLTATICKRAARGVCSMVIDLEDAVADHEVEAAKAQAVRTLDELAAGLDPNPMLFVRVRDADTIIELAERLGPGAEVLTGFVFPKFDSASGSKYLAALEHARALLDRPLYGMPVLESAALVHRQTRDAELTEIAALLAEHRDNVLAVRVGATDMCSTFGIRRDRDLTIYDVRVVADVIADIVNYLGRADGTGFVITGPVWEYFADHERMFRPLLRTAPFEESDAVPFRRYLVSRDLDGLLREITLDRANGIQGKTVIHPSHVAAVHALSVVTHEEYSDALDILQADVGGVAASEYRNKMNEMRPHRSWARQTLLRARVFGVANKGVSFVDLLTALVTV